jgi:single-strand DNA-binding protein
MYQKIVLIGNVGKDPEIRTFENGKLASFSLATSETFKNKQGEKQTNTEWHNINVFGKLADIIEKWVKKGQMLCVEGKVKTRSYDDKDGNKRYVTDIIANEVKMLGGNSDGAKKESSSANNAPAPSNESDDLPW